MEDLKANLQRYIDDPTDPGINYDLAMSYYKLKQLASAFSLFLRCIDLTTDNDVVVDCLLVCSKLLAQQDDRCQKEYDLILHALSVGYDYPEVYYLKSLYHSWRNEWSECYAITSQGLRMLKTFEPRIRSVDIIGYRNKSCLMFQAALAGFKKGRFYESKQILFDIYNQFPGFRDVVDRKLQTYPDNFVKPVKYEGNHSQSMQDIFISRILDHKTNGTYVEIGAGQYAFGNNTFLLESKYDWKGVSVEYNESKYENFIKNRKNPCVRGDAIQLDYIQLFENTFGCDNKTIDYLQLDIDPCDNTYECMLKIPFDDYKFGVITFEHDYYDDKTRSFRDKSRKFLKSKGYKLIAGNVSPTKEPLCPCEDWWIHPDVIANYLKYIRPDDSPIYCKDYIDNMISNKPDKELLKKFKALPLHDNPGNDVYSDPTLSVNELLDTALHNDSIVAVNSEGYFKNEITSIMKNMSWQWEKDFLFTKRKTPHIYDTDAIPLLGCLVCTGTTHLRNLIQSVDFKVDTFIVINNNSELLKDELEIMATKEYKFIKHFKVYHMPYNLGCAHGWNMIIQSHVFAPYWIISNDDIVYEPGLLEEYYNLAKNNENVGMIHSKAMNEVDFEKFGTFELFLIKDWVIRSHGFFDPTFYPAYSEDIDYCLRILNKPIEIINKTEKTYDSVSTGDDYIMKGSTSMQQNSSTKIDLVYARYENHYKINKKWNIWHETEDTYKKMFKHPYNDPSKDISYISYDIDEIRDKWVDFNPCKTLSTPESKISKNIPNLIIVDNFYKNPDEIREYALGLKYQDPKNHGAVGYRCEQGRKILDGTKEYFEQMLKCKIPGGKGIGEWGYSTNGCFQWCNKDVPVVYHADAQEYAGVVYLTPDAPPNAGTSMFRHRKYKSMEGGKVFCHDDWHDPNLPESEWFLDETQWEKVDSAGNVYNRLIIFKSSNVHAVTEYFGNDITDSRLFQLFFFNIT